MSKSKYDIYSNEELLNFIIDLSNKLGRTTGKNDMKTMNNVPSVTIYYRRFNTKKWNDILTLCGLNKTLEYYTKEEGLQKLKEFYNLLGRKPKKNDFKKYNWKPSPDWYVLHFNGIENACCKLGLITDRDSLLDMSIQKFINIGNKLGRHPFKTEYEEERNDEYRIQYMLEKMNLDYISFCKKYLPQFKPNFYKFGDKTQEELFDILTKLKDKLGRTPLFKEIKQNISIHYRRFFEAFEVDNYCELLKLLGWELNKCNEYTLDEGVRKIKLYYKILGHVPSKKEYDDRNWTPWYGWYAERFGSMEQACYELGLTDEKPLTEEERVNITILELKEVAKYLNRMPTENEYNNYRKKGYESSIISKKYDLPFRALCNKLLTNYKPKSENKRRNKDELLNDFYNYYLELGRVPTFEEMSNNNNIATSSTYIKNFGTIKKVCDILELEYQVKSNFGFVCLDKNRNVCKSLKEQTISNYLIDNNCYMEKEYLYKNILSKDDNRRFDWKIDVGNKFYYIEYFGMYHKKIESNSKAVIRYNKKVKRKIRDLYKAGVIDNCIFIFPNDLCKKSLDEIFNKYININNKECEAI